VTNTYLLPQQRINLVLAELWKKSNLTGLITPFSGDEFVGTQNDTLIYKTKGITKARDYEYRNRSRAIVWDEIYRNTLPITIGEHMTVGNKWTDEERKFDMTNFRTEIAAPMAEAMVDRFDSKVLAAIQAGHWAVTDLDIAAPAAADEKDNSALKAALALKGKCDVEGMPARGRRLVLGANAHTFIASSASMLKYDPSQALQVFRQGVSGTIAGFEVVDGSQILGENDILALHPSWAVLANAAPENPESLKFSERASFNGYSARLAAQYDLDYAADRLLLNTFWGISEIKDQYSRHTAATALAANDGSEVGDVVIVDGLTVFTGLNARGASGTFSQL